MYTLQIVSAVLQYVPLRKAELTLIECYLLPYVLNVVISPYYILYCTERLKDKLVVVVV